MKIRIYNARILPMTEEKAGHFQIVEGEIQIIEDKIAYVGSSKIAPSAVAVPEKNSLHQVLMINGIERLMPKAI